MKTLPSVWAKMHLGETDCCAKNSTDKYAMKKSRKKGQKLILAITTSVLHLTLYAPPAIADSNREYLVKPTENYFDQNATQELTGTHVTSAYMKLFDTVNQAIATIGVEFEDTEQQRLLLDLFSGEILRSVYASSSDLSDIAGTAANEIAQFMNLALQKHSGGDPHLAANKRADYKFGFDPNNFCITHTPASVGGNASN